MESKELIKTVENLSEANLILLQEIKELKEEMKLIISEYNRLKTEKEKENVGSFS